MTAPGWHPDPQDPRQLRWWDGTTWTAHVSPSPPTAPGAPTAVPPWSAPTAGPQPPAIGAPSGSTYGAPGPFAAVPAPPAKASRAPLVIILGAVAGVTALVIIAAVVILFAARSDPARTTAATTPTTHPAGHPTTTERVTGGELEVPEDGSLADRAEQAGVPLLDEEGVATHTHSMLHLIVDGEPVRIPANVGIDAGRGKIAALHTHEPYGVLHVESPTRGDTYTLGQFLELWGKGGDQDAVCAAFVDGPCTMTVEVVAPTAEDEIEFDGFGPMPTEPEIDAFGLDTELAQGAVIVVTITSA